MGLGTNPFDSRRRVVLTRSYSRIVNLPQRRISRFPKIHLVTWDIYVCAMRPFFLAKMDNNI